jgi:acetyltransferase-like isoleucine patch superfamily enzyme
MLHKLREKLTPEQKRSLVEWMYTPWILRDRIYCCMRGLAYQQGLRFYGLPKVRVRDRGSIRFGKSFRAISVWRKNSIGVFQPVILKTIRKGAVIQIGDRVGISGSTLSANSHIEIGSDVLIGSGCLITDSDAHPVSYQDRLQEKDADTAPVIIEEGVFIGARSIILKGVTIGRGSVVGAGSVISRDVPPGVVVAGNPARVVKDISPK